MTQNQFKLEDFKVGQKVKVLVDLGTYISEMEYIRLDQIGAIVEIDHCSIRVLFTTALGEYKYFDQWYCAEELQPFVITNAERREEITRLEKQRHDISVQIQDLEQEIHDNPEKIKAEAGDKVRFKYNNIDNGDWIYMYIMNRKQSEQFGGYMGSDQNFRFQGPDGGNPIEVVTEGSHTALEFCKKGDYKWIDSREVDWSGVLN